MLRKITLIARKELFLCILSALLLILSFPGFNIEFFAWFGFVPLFFALQDKSKARAFLISYLAGIIFWLGIIYWLIHVTLPGLVILVLYLALYFGVFGWILSAIRYPLSAFNLLFIPSVWVLLEYLRSHLFTGFPWAFLGYSQYLNLALIQIADITGVWGVSFLVMMVNVVIKEVLGFRFLVLGKREKIQKLFVIIFCFLFLGSVIGYGYFKLNQTPNTKHQTPVKISVIQANIPQELKWDEAERDFIINRYLSFSKEAVNDKPDVIIWPEAALPVVLEEESRYYENVRRFVKEINTPLLLGAVTKRSGLYYNSALLISGEGRGLNRYDKIHLVPFGEYIPLRKILGFLETVVPIGDFTPGEEYTIFELTGKPANRQTKFSVLICFEDLFPDLSRRFVKRGADFLVNITNDAWFGRTSAAYQHLQASVFRAVENRVFLVRAANTGVSGFIAPSGKIISLVEDEKGRNIFISGYDTEKIIIPEKISLSFYSRYGDVFIFVLFIFITCSIFRLVRLNQRAKRAKRII